MSYIIADTCDIHSLICKITLHEQYLNDYTMKLFQLSFRYEQVIGILGTSVTVNYRPQIKGARRTNKNFLKSLTEA